MTPRSVSLPTASVIVPVYNGETTIGDCVRSLLRLDDPRDRLELIVVDNGSTDRTRVVLEEYRNRLRMVKGFLHGRARVIVLSTTATLGLAPPRRPLGEITALIALRRSRPA